MPILKLRSPRNATCMHRDPDLVGQHQPRGLRPHHAKVVLRHQVDRFGAQQSVHGLQGAHTGFGPEMRLSNF